MEHLQAGDTRPLRLRKLFHTYYQSGGQYREWCDLRIDTKNGPASYVLSGNKLGPLYFSMDAFDQAVEIFDVMRESDWLGDRNSVTFSIVSPAHDGNGFVDLTQPFKRSPQARFDDKTKAVIAKWVKSFMLSACGKG